MLYPPELRGLLRFFAFSMFSISGKGREVTDFAPVLLRKSLCDVLL